MLFNKHPKPPQRLLTAEEFEVRIWGFVVVVVTLVLAGIVAFMLYSLAYVTQPIKSMAPMDQAFAKMLNDIVLLIVGGIGGVMSKKGVQSISESMAAKQVPLPPQPQAVAPSVSPVTTAAGNVQATPSMFDFNFGGFQNPALDETWRPGPPPTTPPDYLDPAREEIAHERAAAKEHV
jgi:hypothetical protein